MYVCKVTGNVSDALGRLWPHVSPAFRSRLTKRRVFHHTMHHGTDRKALQSTSSSQHSTVLCLSQVALVTRKKEKDVWEGTNGELWGHLTNLAINHASPAPKIYPGGRSFHISMLTSQIFVTASFLLPIATEKFWNKIYLVPPYRTSILVSLTCF